MSQDKRYAVIVEGVELTGSVVIPQGKRGDEILAEHENWVEVTGMDPRPGVGNGWTYVDGAFVAPPVPPKTRAEVEAERRIAYRAEADPVFFEYQRGDKTKAEWLKAVKAVKKAHPYPPEA